MKVEERGYARAINVRVQQAYPQAFALELTGELRGDGRFADAAFARGDGDDGVDFVEGVDGELGFLVGSHGAHGDIHRSHAGNGADGLFAGGLELLLDWTRRRSKFDGKADVAAVNRKILDKAQRNNIAAKVGIDNVPHGIQDLFRLNHRGLRLVLKGYKGNSGERRDNPEHSSESRIGRENSDECGTRVFRPCGAGMLYFRT